MMNRISHLNGSTVTATDGEVGHVRQAYFDDQTWTVRYLVVDTGSWLPGREVLISPYAVTPPLSQDKKNVDVRLSRSQIEGSPPVDTHQPVSRRHEREQLAYYAFPEYWGGEALWAMNAMPLLTPPGEVERRRIEADTPAEDVHLRSSAEVHGYDISATDGDIGHVEDFVFDERTWAIRALVVDTRNWWPGGKKVLVSTESIESINWGERNVRVKLTREQVKSSPTLDASERVGRDALREEERSHH